MDKCQIGGLLKEVEINLFMTQSFTQRIDQFNSSIEVFKRIASVWLGLKYGELEI